jgi:hypothetical protein
METAAGMFARGTGGSELRLQAVALAYAHEWVHAYRSTPGPLGSAWRGSRERGNKKRRGLQLPVSGQDLPSGRRAGVGFRLQKCALPAAEGGGYSILRKQAVTSQNPACVYVRDQYGMLARIIESAVSAPTP